MSLVVCLFAFLFFKPGRIVFSFAYGGFQKMKTKPIKILSDKKKKIFAWVPYDYYNLEYYFVLECFFSFACLSARLIKRCWVLEMTKSTCTYSP